MSDLVNVDSFWPLAVDCYDVTLKTPGENLALDEVLLTRVNSNPSMACLRLWSSPDYFVVLGRSNQAETEVDIPFCRSRGIPIFRRTSGGGTVVIGPGCLCYSLVLPITQPHRTMGISRVTMELMTRTALGLCVLQPGIEVQGISDLTHCGKKISGNAQRWLRQAFIHHGTILLDFDLNLIERCLRHPTREPEYRQSRRHSSFVENLSIPLGNLKQFLMQAWAAQLVPCPDELLTEAKFLSESRYDDSDWRIRV